VPRSAKWLAADLDKAHHAAHDAAFRAALHAPSNSALHDAAFTQGLGGKAPPSQLKVSKHKKASAERDQRDADAASGQPSGAASGASSARRGSSVQARRIEKQKAQDKLQTSGA